MLDNKNNGFLTTHINKNGFYGKCRLGANCTGHLKVARPKRKSPSSKVPAWMTRFCKTYSAERGSRTPTPVRTHAPETCASTSSAISAFHYRPLAIFSGWRKDEVNFVFIQPFAPFFCELVPTGGIEPPLCCQNWILNPARLPLPPRRQPLHFFGMQS